MKKWFTRLGIAISMFASAITVQAQTTLVIDGTKGYDGTLVKGQDYILPGTDETIELAAGVFERRYRPPRDYGLKYTMDSRLSELLKDEAALSVLREDLPLAAALVDTGDREFLGMTFGDLRFLFFRGLNPPMVEAGTKRLFAMKAFDGE